MKGKVKEPGTDHDPGTAGHATSSKKERSGEGSTGESVKGESTEKSLAGEAGVTEEDLQKGLDMLDDFVSSGDSVTRKQVLLQKAMDDELSKSEQDELFSIMGGQVPASGGSGGEVEGSLGEEIIKSFGDNESFQDALDVSEYLQEQHKELCKSLTVLADHQESSDARQHEFNLILAKAVSDTGKMVKSMAETLGALAGQPVRGPKSQLGHQKPQPLQKSFAGNPGPGDQISKSQVLDALDGMMEKSLSEGRGGMAECGEDLLKAVAKFEQTNGISPRLLNEAKAFHHRSTTAQ